MRKKRTTPKVEETIETKLSDLTKTRENAQQLLLSLGDVKHEIAELQEQSKALEAELLDDLDEMDEKSLTVTTTAGEVLTGTKVQGERVQINDTALKKKLGATMWNKVTERVLDKRKLEDQIAAGEVEVADVAAASTTAKNKPYVKVTRK